jgi:hypothetical protein
MIDLESNDDSWVVTRVSGRSYWDAIMMQVIKWIQGEKQYRVDIAHVRHIVKSDTLV